MVIEFLADGFEEIEAVAPIDILRRAGITVKTVSITGGYTAIGAHGVPFVCDMLVSDIDAAYKSDISAVILPGGMPGAENLYNCDKVRSFVNQINSTGKIVAAICAAPLILGRLGLTEGRTVTCYPGFENELTGATVSNDNAVRDGNIITAKGPGAVFDFAKLLCDALCGSRKTEEILGGMLVN